MSKSRIRIGGCLAAGVLGPLFAAAPAAAADQAVDVNPPLPNVMLLVDTSGSMEYRSSTSSATAQFPNCNISGSSEKSRWIELVEVLTGSVPSSDYHCEKIERTGSSFHDKYSLGGNNPTDYLYSTPHHRIVSSACAPRPGTLPSNAYDWDGAFCYEPPASSVPCVAPGTGCTFSQNPDGLMDSFASHIRFGLMTFDSLADAGTGVLGTVPNPSTGVAGTWSYFLTANGPATGKPAGCTEPVVDYEVGARNAAAPGWEGRMVAFGPRDNSELSVTNDNIQRVLLATRPFGATPITGMLSDARDFFWYDDSFDHRTGHGTEYFSPSRDPQVIGGCRKNVILLLSDGEPNMDLRTSSNLCAVPELSDPLTKGKCPYPEQHYEIAEDMANVDPDDTTHRQVLTYVIGFSVSQVTLSDGTTTVDCKTDLDEFQLSDENGLCHRYPEESALQACCTLNRIAFEGGTSQAIFADNMDELRSAVSSVLSRVTPVTSRTLPVFASATASTSFRFFTSFKPRSTFAASTEHVSGGGGLWEGIIERQRWECSAPTESDECGDADSTAPLIAKPQDISESQGDKFAANVNAVGSTGRTFYTVEGDSTGGIHSDRSIRQNLISTWTDGVGTHFGNLRYGDVNSFVGAVDERALFDAPTTSCTTDGLDRAACASRYLTWLIGGDNLTSHHRCRYPGTPDCNLIADIYHSTPALVNRPTENLRDETYEVFAQAAAHRPLVLYASTNDGLLHAFKVASNDPTETSAADRVTTQTNNELWSFIPPAVLPDISNEYPNVHTPLLDGAPVVRDVAGVQSGSVVRFERTLSDFTGGNVEWHTVLVQGFGSSRGGYFALDITDPEAGPQFLWQLTRTESGDELFGKGGTPAITTLYFSFDNEPAHEIAVALLPGGDAATRDPSDCPREVQVPDGVDSRFTVREQVPCYSDQAVLARSLTVVRLDTGQIVRSFRRSPSEVPSLATGLVAPAGDRIDSPITGQPVAYPGWTGAVADRAYVGDRDGTLWRVDLSSTDPDDWTMKLFFDAYAGRGTHDGQPIVYAPVVSTTELGNITVAFATGEQETLAADEDMHTFLYSLTENPTADFTGVESTVNWYQHYAGGERVSGPLSLLSGALYFSTYQPEDASSVNACGTGSSRIGGMHYTIREETSAGPLTDGSNALSRGGTPQLPEDACGTSSTRTQYLDQTSSMIESGAMIFGVSVAQVPSCVVQDSIPDTFLSDNGTEERASLDFASPARFELVVQTGAAGETVGGGATRIQTIRLPPPDNSPRISSWAQVME